MIVSAIAGWFVRRIWPTGVIVVLVISAINALIQFIRYEQINANRHLTGLGTYNNDIGVVLAGFVIDVVINFVAFCIVWFVRSKVKPHANENQTIEDNEIDATDY